MCEIRKSDSHWIIRLDVTYRVKLVDGYHHTLCGSRFAAILKFLFIPIKMGDLRYLMANHAHTQNSSVNRATELRFIIRYNAVAVRDCASLGKHKPKQHQNSKIALWHSARV